MLTRLDARVKRGAASRPGTVAAPVRAFKPRPPVRTPAAGHDTFLSSSGDSGMVGLRWQSRLARDKAFSVRQREQQLGVHKHLPPPPLGAHYNEGGELAKKAAGRQNP